MSIRLNKAIRELNIGLQTAADFLMKKYGVEGADNPALKLTDEWYEGLCKEFSTDAAVRTQVDKMAQKVKEKKPSIAIEKSEEQPAEQPAKQQYKPLGKIDLSQVGKPKVKKDEEKEIKKTEEEKIEVPVATAESQETVVEPAPEAIEPQKAEAAPVEEKVEENKEIGRAHV